MKTKKKVTVKKKVHKDLIGEMEGKLARALADYDNLRRRFEREKDHILSFATKGMVARFLTIYDMLESAQDHIGDSGIAIILEEFKKILQDEQVEKIKVEKGDKFDEDLCDAVESVKGNEKNEGKIAEIVLSGWKFMDGPVVRPTKVKVYKQV